MLRCLIRFAFMCALVCVMTCFLLPNPALAEEPEPRLEGLPLGYMNGCQLDMDRDGQQDLVMVLSRGPIGNPTQALLVLLARGDGYEAHVLSQEFGQSLLTCQWGEGITGWSEGMMDEVAEKKVFAVNGGYVRLTLPESSSSVFFWQNGKFVRVWTSD